MYVLLMLINSNLSVMRALLPYWTKLQIWNEFVLKTHIRKLYFFFIMMVVMQNYIQIIWEEKFGRGDCNVIHTILYITLNISRATKESTYK